MARKRSELLGSLGKLFSIFKKVADKVLEYGGDDEVIAQLDTDSGLVAEIALLLVEREKRLEDTAGLLEHISPLSTKPSAGTISALRAFKPRELQILDLRLDPDKDERHTLEDVGKIFRYTRERIRQIEEKAKSCRFTPSEDRDALE